MEHSLKETIKRIDELATLRDEHYKQLAVAESKRIDAIRSVDVNAVSVASERAGAQALVLAAQVSTSAETLRSLVATTAATQATQLSTLTIQITDRLTALEKAQYEKRGSGTGMRDLYGWGFGALMLIVSIVSVVFTILHHV